MHIIDLGYYYIQAGVHAVLYIVHMTMQRINIKMLIYIKKQPCWAYNFWQLNYLSFKDVQLKLFLFIFSDFQVHFHWTCIKTCWHECSHYISSHNILKLFELRCEENQQNAVWDFPIPPAEYHTKAEQAASWQKNLYFSRYYGQIRHAADLPPPPPPTPTPPPPWKWPEHCNLGRKRQERSPFIIPPSYPSPLFSSPLGIYMQVRSVAAPLTVSWTFSFQQFMCFSGASVQAVSISAFFKKKKQQNISPQRTVRVAAMLRNISPA